MNPLIPATPTFMPTAPIAPVAIQYSAWRIWAFADDAVMVWQQITPARPQVIQIAIIVIIVIAFVALATKWAQSFTNQGDL